MSFDEFTNEFSYFLVKYRELNNIPRGTQSGLSYQISMSVDMIQKIESGKRKVLEEKILFQILTGLNLSLSFKFINKPKKKIIIPDMPDLKKFINELFLELPSNESISVLVSRLPDFNYFLAKELIARRKALNITQAELAELAGISRNTLIRIESFESNIQRKYSKKNVPQSIRLKTLFSLSKFLLLA